MWHQLKQEPHHGTSKVTVIICDISWSKNHITALAKSHNYHMWHQLKLQLTQMSWELSTATRSSEMLVKTVSHINWKQLHSHTAPSIQHTLRSSNTHCVHLVCLCHWLSAYQPAPLHWTMQLRSWCIWQDDPTPIHFFACSDIFTPPVLGPHPWHPQLSVLHDPTQSSVYIGGGANMPITVTVCLSPARRSVVQATPCCRPINVPRL